MRANLMSDLRLYIEKHKLTQSDVAKRLGIAQSRVSDLVHGKWNKFSLEMLITLEARIGRTVRVEFAAQCFPDLASDINMPQSSRESQVPGQATALADSPNRVNNPLILDGLRH